MNNFFYGEIQSNDITIDKNELSLRLLSKRGEYPKNIDKLESILKQNVNAKYSAQIVNLKCENNIVILDGVKIESSSLYKNLNGCEKAIVLCVTLGSLVDKLLLKYSIKSTYEHFVIDALSSALCESLCDLVDKTLTKNLKTKNRFSIGYGDLSLAYQNAILKMANAEKYLNVKLSESLLMSPTKTITAIIGIENERSK